ncbi:A24 family peptidase [Roseibium sp.]|uniref:A24 family peptidase n=1 Tax=Roseibium sp. TaxID=1936156 RepID=UPI003B51A5AC
MIEALVIVFFPMLVAFAGASDLLTMKIGNRVSILLIFGFGLLALALELPLAAWGMHGLGLLVLFLPCFAFFAAGWMGGGDVKLISSIGLWFGFSPLLVEFLFFVAVFGCVLTVSILMVRRYFVVLPEPLTNQEWLLRLHDEKSGIPYGIAIAAAALLMYPMSDWFGYIGH